MLRPMISFLGLFALLISVPSLGAEEIIDLEKAGQDPDFAVQGEYRGKWKWPGEKKQRIGAQVVARSDHRFRVVVYKGGVARRRLEARRRALVYGRRIGRRREQTDE